MNEALHSEINRWCSNQPEVFATTVELQLQIAFMAKLKSHNCALYYPTLRQMRPSNVLHRAVSVFRFPQSAWCSWCETLARQGVNRVRPAVLPLHCERTRVAKAVRSHGHHNAPKRMRINGKQTIVSRRIIGKCTAVAVCLPLQRAAAASRTVRKRPAATGFCIPRKRPAVLKRTVFTLRRVRRDGAHARPNAL